MEDYLLGVFFCFPQVCVNKRREGDGGGGGVSSSDMKRFAVDAGGGSEEDFFCVCVWRKLIDRGDRQTADDEE